MENGLIGFNLFLLINDVFRTSAFSLKGSTITWWESRTPPRRGDRASPPTLTAGQAVGGSPGPTLGPALPADLHREKRELLWEDCHQRWTRVTRLLCLPLKALSVPCEYCMESFCEDWLFTLFFRSSKLKSLNDIYLSAQNYKLFCSFWLIVLLRDD